MRKNVLVTEYDVRAGTTMLQLLVLLDARAASCLINSADSDYCRTRPVDPEQYGTLDQGRITLADT